jgi:hypothetical protein
VKAAHSEESTVLWLRASTPSRAEEDCGTKSLDDCDSDMRIGIMRHVCLELSWI